MILSCEGYKMFRGSATVVPKNPAYKARKEYGTWLYKPEWDCWYVNGSSYPAEIVQDIEDE